MMIMSIIVSQDSGQDECYSVSEKENFLFSLTEFVM